MFLNYVPIFLCGSKVTFIIRYQNIKTLRLSGENTCQAQEILKIEILCTNPKVFNRFNKNKSFFHIGIYFERNKIFL